MFGALKHGFRSLATLKVLYSTLVVMLSANFKPKGTAAASRGFLATAPLSCIISNEVFETIRNFDAQAYMPSPAAITHSNI